MSRMLEAELLRTFVAIAEAGSFTEAARRVRLTQSAVSMQMKRLEEALGRALFARSGRSVQLTADGERLIGHARRILSAHQDVLAAFADPRIEGTVTIGTPDQYASAFLPDILARFSATHPRVHVEVVCDVSANLLVRLAEETLDVALVTRGECEEGDLVLLQEPVVWVTSARHGAHERTPLPLALFQPGCNYRRWALQALDRAGRPFRLAYTSMSMAGIGAAVRAGLAVSAVPLSGVGDGLRILGERDGFPALPSYRLALRRSAARSSPLLDRLEDHILDSLSGSLPPTMAAA